MKQWGVDAQSGTESNRVVYIEIYFKTIGYASLYLSPFISLKMHPHMLQLQSVNVRLLIMSRMRATAQILRRRALKSNVYVSIETSFNTLQVV